MALENHGTGTPRPRPSLSPREHPPDNYQASEETTPEQLRHFAEVSINLTDVEDVGCRYTKTVWGYIPPPTRRNIPCPRYDPVLTDRFDETSTYDRQLFNLTTDIPEPRSHVST